MPISQIMKEISADHRQLAIGTALEVFGRLIIRSPVGDPSTWKHKPPPGYVGGAFRGNWMIATTQEPTGFDTKSIDATGAHTIANAANGVMSFQLGHTIMIRNNLPYALPLEYGWSNQAPEGMVRVTSNELPAVVREVGQGLAARDNR